MNASGLTALPTIDRCAVAAAWHGIADSCTRPPARASNRARTACVLAFAFSFALTACVRQPHMAIEPAPVRSACRQVVPSSLRLTWIGPTTPRDRARLDRWCTAVGPAAAAAIPAAESPAVDRLPIVVWNVHEGGGDLERLIDALTRGNLTAGAPPSAFVLLLQEVYRAGDTVPAQRLDSASGPRAIVEHPPSGNRRSALDIARAHGFAFVYAPSMRNSPFAASAEAEDRGNAIVSTLPIADPAAIELPFERQRRVALAATIAGRTTSGVLWRVRVADVHLDTSLAITRGGPFAARRRQAIALIEALGSSPVPTVVAGDFNTWLGKKEAASGALRRAFPDAAAEDTGTTWRGPLGSHAALDRVFARNVAGHISVRRIADRFGSDHYPLLAMIDVRRN